MCYTAQEYSENGRFILSDSSSIQWDWWFDIYFVCWTFTLFPAAVLITGDQKEMKYEAYDDDDGNWKITF